MTQQLSRTDLETMTPEAICAARSNGQLDSILGIHRLDGIPPIQTQRNTTNEGN